MYDPTTIPLPIDTIDLMAVPAGTAVDVEAGLTLLLQHRFDLAGWSIASPGRARVVVLTEDGRHADLTAWHAGPTTGEAVYVERYEGRALARRTFHGYVDPTSRQIVQVG